MDVATIAAAHHRPSTRDALAHGYGTAYPADSTATLVARALVALLVTTGPHQERQ